MFSKSRETLCSIDSLILLNGKERKLNSINRVIVVHVGDVLKCPPALNVIRLANRRGLKTSIVTTRDNEVEKYRASLPEACSICLTDGPYNSKASIVSKAIDIAKIKKQLLTSINSQYVSEETVVWVVSDVTLKHLGESILNYNYVLHLMELSEELYYSKKAKFLKLNAKKISDSALAVVVPNKSRACITQAWWGLEKEPIVLPNKPVDDLHINRNSTIKDEQASCLMEGLKGKKIVLYQGIAHRERPLKPFFEAVKKIGDPYVFVTVGANDPLPEVRDSQYCHVPFVQPPGHLEITSHAWIGVLSYFPVKAQYSILNAVFCAPNKSFEYARFGIPMISNSNCELEATFERFQCGKSIKDFSIDNIALGLKEIDAHYAEYSEGAEKYYSSVDMDCCFESLLNELVAAKKGGN